MSQATLGFSRVTHAHTCQNLYLHPEAQVFRSRVNKNPWVPNLLGVMPSEMTSEPHKGSASVNGHCHAALWGLESHLVGCFMGVFSTLQQRASDQASSEINLPEGVVGLITWSPKTVVALMRHVLNMRSMHVALAIVLDIDEPFLDVNELPKSHLIFKEMQSLVF